MMKKDMVDELGEGEGGCQRLWKENRGDREIRTLLGEGGRMGPDVIYRLGSLLN